METTPSPPWHKASFDRFLHHDLQELLMARLRLKDYRAESTGPHACRITLQFATADASFEVNYPVPAPDDGGIFRLEGAELIVSPVGAGDDPETEIRCVGDRLYEFIESRLGRIPADAVLDVSLIETLAPLTSWFRAFLSEQGESLNDTNWLARRTHQRRLRLPDRQEVFTAGHFGRTCPFETPEGPNIGRVLAISRGADIRDGRLVIVDDSPAAGLGWSASAIPFLEHDDGNRVLMGANMMRQWLPPAESETALIQTGLEPDDPEFWCGRNLLTAFVSWDGYVFEDAVVISESCAVKLSCPQPLEPGDKLSLRHGLKSVVGRVLPDAAMPALADGTPVEVIYSICGVPSRWTLGPIREATLSRIAQAQGRPVIVPPFAAPSNEELRQMLREAGLPENGMETLSADGKPLHRPCTVGWVYWGCTLHLASSKILSSVTPDGPCNRVGTMEVEALRQAGALTVIREFTNTTSCERDDASTLAHRVSVGNVEQPETPSPQFANVKRRLAAAGIAFDLSTDGISFGFREPTGDAVDLACPVEHPWLPERMVSHLPDDDGSERWQALRDANDRLVRLQDQGAPQSLTDGAHRQLVDALRDFFDALLSTSDLQLGTNVMFSGRAVLAPGPDLQLDQLGLPEEIAWPLFTPIVSRTLGDPEAIQQRNAEAHSALEKAMADSWVILNRAPSVTATALVAFRPVLIPERAFRLHPVVCALMDSDFDGDQAAVHLPVTRAAQQEAGDKLSIAGHLERDTGLIDMLCPAKDALFGLACLSMTIEGRQTIAEIAGRDLGLDAGTVTRGEIVEGLRRVLMEDGTSAAMETAQRLWRLGFEAARAEGGSIGPFVGATIDIPTPPHDDDEDQWQAYQQEIDAIVGSWTDFDDEDFGAVSLLRHSGARASTRQVAQLIAPQGPVRVVGGHVFNVRSCWRSGITAEEAMARVVGARRGLFRILEELEGLGRTQEASERPGGHGVLARARRARRPGVVFARAATVGEVDPLTDEYARLFVGISD